MVSSANFQKRALLFVFGCMGSRLLITYLSSIPEYSKKIALVLLLPAIGFIYIYALGLRKTGGETFGDPIWWNNLRPVHALSLLIFSALALSDNSRAWVILLIDTLIGAIAWMLHHFS
jgi:hypothetical protein